jgi:hypothetical protein
MVNRAARCRTSGASSLNMGMVPPGWSWICDGKSDSWAVRFNASSYRWPWLQTAGRQVSSLAMTRQRTSVGGFQSCAEMSVHRRELSLPCKSLDSADSFWDFWTRRQGGHVSSLDKGDALCGISYFVDRRGDWAGLPGRNPRRRHHHRSDRRRDPWSAGAGCLRRTYCGRLLRALRPAVCYGCARSGPIMCGRTTSSAQ